MFAFDLEVMLHRIEQNKVPHWSRIGRLKRATMPKFSVSIVPVLYIVSIEAWFRTWLAGPVFTDPRKIFYCMQ